MLKNDLYYGLPEIVWTNLCEQAEEILYEENIGQIIVGYYPAGNRIFGLESESPEILCLYVDSEENILNPIKISQSYRIPVGYSGSYINFLDLWAWVASLPSKRTIETIIPCFQDPLYQEDLIEPLLPLVKELVINNPVLRLNNKYDKYLQKRMEYILAKYKTFTPNVNPEWDKVTDINYKVDEQFIEKKLNNIYIQEYFVDMAIRHLSKELVDIHKDIDSTLCNDIITEIGKRTSELYKSII